MPFDRSPSLLNSITAHVSQSMIGAIHTQSQFNSMFGNIGDASGNASAVDPFERSQWFVCGTSRYDDSGSQCGGTDKCK